MRKRRLAVAALLAAVIATAAWWHNIDREPEAAQAIAGAAVALPSWSAGFEPAPVAGAGGVHPFLAPGQNGTMHGDEYQSDVHLTSGPLGGEVEVRTRRAANGMPRQCATFVFRSDGKVVAMCGGLSGFRMVLLDPDSLAALAHYDLPIRPSAFEAVVKRDRSIMSNDTSGGAYLFLDNRDRLVFADSRNVVQRLVVRQQGADWHFAVDREWDLKPHVPHDCLNWNNWFPSGECDKVTTVMPDHGGLLWWTTRNGRLGTIEPETGRVAAIRLDGEEIQNSLAMDSNAAYVLSDHAQYAFRADGAGKPVVMWRQAYDRGATRKVGSINQGSGTTPTLIGDRWITFADNADGRINLVVLRRGMLAPGQPREVCKVPVFREGASATDNSMIGWGRSILLENNAGYASAHARQDWNSIAGGVVRVDIRNDESGCDVIWESPLKSPSVVGKLAVQSGIAWFYTFDPGKDRDGRPTQDWALAGLDFRTGRLVAKIPTGQGKAFDNNWSSLALSPGGELYVGTTRGLVQVRQRK